MASMEESAIPEALKPLVGSLKEMFENPKHADLVVICGDPKWPVNKNIVCSQSEFFAKACEGGFKEAEEHVITLKEDSPSIVEAMLRNLYTFSYSDETNDLANGHQPIVFDVHVHIIADKYGLPSLAKLAEAKFEKRAKSEWKTDGFAEAAGLVYTNAADQDHKLRDTVIAVASNHAKDLYTQDYGLCFQGIVGSVPSFGSDLAHRLATNTAEPAPAPLEFPKFRCGSCRKVFSASFENTSTYYYCMFCGGERQGYSWYNNCRAT